MSIPKTENFQIIFFFLYFSYFCSKHRLWVLVRGSNEYPQSMFLSRNKQNNVYPCKLQFYYIKVGFKGVKLYMHVFVMFSDIIREMRIISVITYMT